MNRSIPALDRDSTTRSFKKRGPKAKKTSKQKCQSRTSGHVRKAGKSRKRTRQSETSGHVRIVTVPLCDIEPSPENDGLYGAIDPKDLELINLANDIAKNGIREPLQVSEDGFIISGHRRYAAAKLVSLVVVPVRRLAVRRDEHTRLQWLQVLRAHNHQRVKPRAVRMKEALLDVDPDLAYQQLIEERQAAEGPAPEELVIRGEMNRAQISDVKRPMLEAAQRAIESLKAFWPLSVRQIHYTLLNDPPLRNSRRSHSHYTNDKKSYSDLCDLLARARLDGLAPWNAICDPTRPVSGTEYSKDVAEFVDIQSYHFLRNYRRDLLQSQPDHIELIAEKQTVQTIVEQVARQYCVPTTIGRGYCSLDPRKQMSDRFRQSGKHRLVLLVASDFDPDGEEIAQSLARSLRDDFGVEDLLAIKVLLTPDQIDEWDVPPNGLEAKKSSPNYKKFYEEYGAAVYELEAIPPERFQDALSKAIESVLDLDVFNEELAQEKEDAVKLQATKSEVMNFLQFTEGLL